MRQITFLVFILATTWIKPTVAGEAPQSLARATQPPVQKEADKAQRIKAILRKHPMYPQASVSNPAFCGPLLEALKNASRTISYVEPVLRTDNPNHPRLKHYHRCDGATYPGGPPDNAFDAFDAIGHKNFKLYRVDLDNNPENGIEEIIYAEVDWEKRFANQFPAYTVADLNQCLIVAGIPVHQEVQPDGQTLGNYNALIRYQKRYYVLDLDNIDQKQENYNLTLWNFKSNAKQQKDIIPCAWSWRKDPLSKESEEK